MIYIHIFTNFVVFYLLDKYLESSLESKNEKNKRFIIVLLFSVAKSLIILDPIYNLILSFFMIVLYAMTTFYGGLLRKIYTLLIFFCIMVFSEEIVPALLMLIFPILNPMENKFDYTIMMLSTSIFEYIIIKISLSIFLFKNSEKLSKLELLSLLIIPCTYIIIIVYIYLVSNNSFDMAIMSIGLIVIATLFLLSILSLSLFMRKMIMKNEAILNYQVMEHQNRIQEIISKEMVLRDKQNKKFQHDIAKHINVMKRLLEEEEYTSLNNYLTSLSDEYVFEGSNAYITGNVYLDLILNSYFEELQGTKIIFQISKIDLSFIDPIHQTIIFGNIIENAIFSMKKTKKKELLITFANHDKNFYILKFINSCEEVKIDKHKFLSLKFDGGIGLQNIEEQVHKYNGYLDVNYDDLNKEFTTSITLPIPFNKDDVLNKHGCNYENEYAFK